MGIDGFSTTVFCYGQTGSGKTHTLTGPPYLVSLVRTWPNQVTKAVLNPTGIKLQKLSKKPLRNSNRRSFSEKRELLLILISLELDKNYFWKFRS
jgi:hypothetical protein